MREIVEGAGELDEKAYHKILTFVPESYGDCVQISLCISDRCRYATSAGVQSMRMPIVNAHIVLPRL